MQPWEMAMGVFHEILGDAAENDYAVGEPGRPGPTIEPGEIRLVECDPAGLSPAHAGLLRQANVVLYERALGAALAEALPTGLYAEKLPAAARPVISARARHFAADGWSVLQLIERRDGREQFAQFAVEYLDRSAGGAPPGPRSRAQGQMPGQMPGQIFTANGLAG
jgi:hypothetical protein